MKPTKSIIQTEKVCFLCGCCQEELLSEHHVYGGGRRTISEKLGLKVWLCYICHRLIHDNNKQELELKRYAQRVFESKGNSRETFIKYIGKSYL